MSWNGLGWYVSIFCWLYFTGICIPPCPEEAGILYAATVAALQPSVCWWLAWPSASAGFVCADVTLYWIGRLWGRRLFEYRWVKHIINLERRQRIESMFQQRGIAILLMARLLPPLRTGVFVTAGAIHFSFLRFLLADAGYCTLGVGLFFLGSTWLIALIHLVGHWLAYVAVILGIGYALYRYFRFLREREQRGKPVPASVLELRHLKKPSNGTKATTPPSEPDALATAK
jgi:membrane protein DedA with SNARE-associated domain